MKHHTPFYRTLAILPLAVGAVISTSTHAQTVTAVMESGLRVTDPVVTTADMTIYHGYMIYDTLLGVDENFNIRPQMADWQVADDNKTYTFTLRDGLKWHDGAPVTSEDCIASIKRWGQVDVTGQILMSMVAHMRALDDQRFEIQLSEPSPILLEGLSQLTRALFMMPRRVADTPATTPLTEYVGSGPFKFVESEFQPGLKVVYEKNTDYVPRNEPPSWTAGGKVVHVDRVEWLGMPDHMTTISALQSGEIDYIQEVPFDLVPLLQNRDEVKVEVLDTLGFWTFFRLNHLNPPFDNKLLRQAAQAAVSQEEVLKALAGNPAYYETCAAVLGCGNPLADTYGKEWVVPADLERARALLKEANYDGTPVVILQTTDLYSIAPQPVVVGAALRRAGFNVEMKAMDWQSVVTQRESQKPTSEGGWSLFATASFLAIGGSPITNFTIAAAGTKSWTGWPDVPEIERLRERFVRETDPDARKAITAQIQKLVIDEVTVVPLGQFRVPAAYSTALTDVPRGPIRTFWGLKKSVN